MAKSQPLELTTVTVTPDLAKRWLAQNKKNRPLSDHTVATYASAMRRGEWRLNGEAITFADDGTLLNGQHRLNACIKAASPFQTIVVTGVDKASFSTVDGGKKRTAADVLAIRGEKNYNAVAAAARAILQMTLPKKAAWTITNTQVDECFRAHPGIAYWADLSGAARRKKLFPSAFIGVITLMEELHGREITEPFFEQCVDGVGLAVNSPAHTLREKFIERRRGVQFSQHVALAYFVKAANAHLQSREIKLLRLSEDENAPRLLGLAPAVE